MSISSLLWLVALLGPPEPSESAELDVRVRTAGRRQPVVGVRVILVPDGSEHRPGHPLPAAEHIPEDAQPDWIQSATTSSEGEASFDEVPNGRVRVVVVAPGYERFEQVVVMPRQRGRALWVAMSPDLATTYRTVVQAPPPPARAERVTSHLLSKEEIATLPGTQGDPLRALQNLPGVARTPGGLGLLVLRGATPNQSRVFYGEHALPIAFHAVAFASVVPADATDGIEFIPSNGPARYGETTAGVVVIEPARPSPAGYHGFGEVDLTGAAALVSGPIGKGSFLTAVNRGWVDWALRGVEEIAGDATTFVLPKYIDYQGLFDYPLPSGGSVGVRVLGSRDHVSSRVYNPRTEEREPLFEIEAQFHRADLVYRRRQGAWGFLASPSFRFEQNRVGGFGDRRREDYIFSWRAEVSRRLSARSSFLLGTDAEVDTYRARAGETEFSVAGPVPIVRRFDGVQTAIGLYGVAEARFGALTLWPSARLSMYSLRNDAEVVVDPRLSARWDVADRWWLTFGAGLYSQAVALQTTFQGGFLADTLDRLAGNVVFPAAISALEPRAGFEPAGDEVRVARAAQASTGAGFAVNDAWSVEASVFGRLRDNADGVATFQRFGEEQVRAQIPITYDRAYGLEALIRHRPVGRWYGWVAYTLSRIDTGFERAYGSGGPARVGLFDQRHILALVASVELPRRWRVGGRFRLVSGSPYQPVVGVFDRPPSDSRRPIYGEIGSARFPLFHQLDLRVDRRWLFRYATLTTYLDVQNVYNWFNVEAYIYTEDYGQPFSAVGLPVLPSLGVRVDF